jgi:hypothetical protein
MSNSKSKHQRKMMKRKTCFCLAVPREEATFFPACGWFHGVCQGQIYDPKKIYSPESRLRGMLARESLKAAGIIVPRKAGA